MKKRKKQKNPPFCNPDICPHCLYIGGGDSWCEEIHKVVLDDWQPTEHYMGEGCQYRKRSGRSMEQED